MRNRLLSKICVGVLLAVHLCADSVVWNTAQIPVPGPFQGVAADVIVSPGPTPGTAVAVWRENNSNNPNYSIYDSSTGTWTTAAAIPLGSSAGVAAGVYVTAGPIPGQLVATWANNDSIVNAPYFSLYNGTTWSPGDLIPRNGSDGAFLDVVVAPGPGAGEVTAIWTNFRSPQRPYFSIYNGSAWATNILDSTSDVYGDVFLTPGLAPGTLIATWKDGVTGNPTFSVYSGGVWSAGAAISASAEVLADVVPALDPVSGQVVATWADRLSQVVTYSFYNGVTWTPPATIDMGSSIGCFNDPYVAAEPTGALVVTWSNTDSARVPYFSIYQNGVWSTGAPIPLSPSASTGTLQDTAIARVAGTSIMVATWGGDSDELPYYSTFVGLPTTGLLPPTDGQGSHVKNRFALLIEWYNQLDWTASTSPDVVGYNIRRNGALIASHVFGTSYRDGNRPHKGTDVYSITSVNAEGLESVATLEITVTN